MGSTFLAPTRARKPRKTFHHIAKGVQFRQANGSEYGRVVQPRAAEIQTKAFAALRGLGFREGDVRRVLAELPMGESFSVERVLRDALKLLTGPD